MLFPWPILSRPGPSDRRLNLHEFASLSDRERGGKKKIRKDCYGGFDLLAVDVKWRTAWLIQTMRPASLFE